MSEILDNLNDEMLCKQLCTRVTLHHRKNDIVMLDTPFSYPDGDRYPLYLEESNIGVRISDGGHTLMHLSYENDIDKLFIGSRSRLFEQILSENDIGYDPGTGQFFVEAPVADLASAVFRLGQGLSRIYDLTFLNRSRVASTFYEDLNEAVLSVVPAEQVQRDYIVPSLPGGEDYPVDFQVEGKQGVPVFLMGIQNRDKARLATIFLQYFHQHNVQFESLLVFEDQQEIPRPDLARLSNAGGEMIASLNAEDDFRRKLGRKAA